MDVATAIGLAGEADPEVRQRAAGDLPLLMDADQPEPEAVAALVQLTRDDDSRVRDMACFALAEQLRPLDNPVIREALADRLDDVDLDTRAEALVGLAYRHDPRALPRVRSALGRPTRDVWLLEMVAAGALGDSSVHQLVLRHLDGWDDESAQRKVEAVRRLTDPAGPGDDLFIGMATLYRGRAQDADFDEGLRSWQLMEDLLEIAPHRAPEFLERVALLLADEPAALHELRSNSALAAAAS